MLFEDLFDGCPEIKQRVKGYALARFYSVRFVRFDPDDSQMSEHVWVPPYLVRKARLSKSEFLFQSSSRHALLRGIRHSALCSSGLSILSMVASTGFLLSEPMSWHALSHP